MRTVTEIGKYIREVLATNSTDTNTAIAEMVMARFTGQTFDATKLRQRIANTRFVLKQESKVSSGEDSTTSA